MSIIRGVITTLDNVVRNYTSLSSPRVLVTTLDQQEIATAEGDRFSFSQSFSNFDSGTPLYLLIENPIGSGVNIAFQQRILKTYSDGLITFQVLWDYDASTATKTPLPLFNENNIYRGIEDSKLEASVLNPVTNPTAGDWTINGAATVIDDGIQREIDFIPATGQGSNTSGGVSSGLGFRFYKEGTGGIVKMVSSGDNNRVIVGYSWIEVPSSL